jgi:hypothetical protein
VLVRSTHPTFDESRARAAIAGLPEAGDYTLVVKPLRYRTQPRLSGLTEFETRTITVQIPEPFHPFGDVVVYGSKRLAAKGMKFVPLSEGVSFRTRAEVVRFLYCHEWYHWFLWEVVGSRSFSETACDRFALLNWRRRAVTLDDARAAMRRRRST